MMIILFVYLNIEQWFYGKSGKRVVGMGGKVLMQFSDSDKSS